MDIGLDRLFDMIEQRFGQRAANLLLALVYLGVAGWCVHSVYEYLIQPIIPLTVALVDYARGVELPTIPQPVLAWRDVLEAVIAIVIGVCVLGLTWRSEKKWRQRNAIVDRMSLDDLTNAFLKLIDENKALRGQLGLTPDEDASPPSPSIKSDPGKEV